MIEQGLAMNHQERRNVPAATRVDIDYSRPVYASGRHSMYSLPLRANLTKADDMVLSLDHVSMRCVPSGTAESGVNGIVLLMCLACLLFPGMTVLFATSIFASPNDRPYDIFISCVFLLFMGLFSFGAIKAAIAMYKWQDNMPIAWPTIFNRRDGTVIQMQGKRRFEAAWADLLPYIEQVPTGSVPSFNLALLRLGEEGARAQCHIQVQRAQGIYNCLAIYEFVARYMEGNWDDLPEIPVLPGLRPGFWDAYRHGFWNPWIGEKEWVQRNRLSRARMYLWVPIWTILLFPIVILTMIGTRMGWEPTFPNEDIEAARCEVTRDGPVPAALTNKIRQPSPVHPTERRLYIAVWSAATLCWVLSGVAMLVL